MVVGESVELFLMIGLVLVNLAVLVLIQKWAGLT